MTTKRSRVILCVSLAVLLIISAVVIQTADDYIMSHPTIVETAAPDPSAEEIDTVLPIGSTDDSPVHYSIEPGFYDSTQRLVLSADDAVEIYYSRDGSDPRNGGSKYRNAVTLRADSDGVNIYDITAVAQYADGTFSEPVTRSFIVGKNITSRFDCLVFSISIDPDYLYNYEDGIFIAGKMRDDYLALPKEERYPELQPTDPANWNQRGMAGERPAHLEVFEYDGTCVISQDCGLRIFGGWSRSNDQKNLRLYARTEYDEVNNRFRYEFFPDALDSQGNKIVSYKKLSLRACANDNGYLFARDDAISALAQATGIESKYSRPAAVFLNGEYYGFAWCQQVFSEDLLDHKYNVDDGEWDILKGCEYMMIEDEEDPDWAEMNAAWREMYDYAYKDLTDDAVFAELEKLIDIDNFFTYYAMNSYIGNGDWPNNNYKVFRYKQGSVPMSDEAPYDGRWRYMLYDTDFAFGLYGNDFMTIHIQQLFKEENFGIYPEDWRADVHDKGDQYYKRSDLLIALCKRDDMRERFVSIMSDISGYYFNAERVANYLDEYHTWRLHELVEASNAGKANVWSVQRELDSCKDWIKKRPYAARTQLANVFEEYDRDAYYTVNCEPVEGATIHINTANVVSDDVAFGGWYFDGIEVPISATLEQGVKFESWEINSKVITEPETVISRELYGDSVNITLNVKREGGIKVMEVAYKGTAGGDCVVLKNYSSEPASTQGLVISDGTNELMLPTMTIPAGGTIKMIGKNYNRVDALGSVELGFNLKEGEVVTLRNANGEILSRVELRDAHKKTALLYEPYSGKYIETSSNYKDRILEAELPTWDWGNWGWGGGWGW